MEKYKTERMTRKKKGKIRKKRREWMSEMKEDVKADWKRKER